MQRSKLLGLALLMTIAVLVLITGGCFSGSSDTVGSTPSVTANVLKPLPKVEEITANTTGSESNYVVFLHVKVKNNGANGTIVLQGKVTQNGMTITHEMSVYDLKKGETREVVLEPFSLVWKGGDWSADVKAIVP